MISNTYQFFVDKTTSEHYVALHDLSHLFGAFYFKIPKEEVLKIYKHLHIYKNALYQTLKGLDNDFYVLIEQKPGQGFERVVPAHPKYNPSSVREFRNIVLHEIEHLSELGVQVHYQIDTQTLEVSAILTYPTPINYTEQIVLEATSPVDVENRLYSREPGFFAASEEMVIYP